MISSFCRKIFSFACFPGRRQRIHGPRPFVEIKYFSMHSGWNSRWLQRKSSAVWNSGGVISLRQMGHWLDGALESMDTNVSVETSISSLVVSIGDARTKQRKFSQNSSMKIRLKIRIGTTAVNLSLGLKMGNRRLSTVSIHIFTKYLFHSYFLTSYLFIRLE